MKVLLALPGPPTREGAAAARCHIGLIRGLSAHGIDVHVVCARLVGRRTNEPILIDPDIPEDIAVEHVRVPLLPAGLRSAFHRAAEPMQEFGRRPISRLIGERAGAFDVVHLEETQMTYCADRSEAPAVLHLHNLLRFDLDLRPWRPYFIYALERHFAEQAAFRRKRPFIASSSVVADVIGQEVPGADITIAPLTLDPTRYPAAPLDGPPTAGIIGNANWPVTGRAMRRLVERVWPLVHSQVPDARLLIAGLGLGDGGARIGLDRFAACHLGIEVIGEVPTAAGFLQGLSVLLYPLSRGSGMKQKVLESIACGVPVVTTRSGAEGIDGDGVVVHTEDGALADAAVSILRDTDERRQRGELARKTFLERYAPRPATEPLVDLYRRIAR